MLDSGTDFHYEDPESRTVKQQLVDAGVTMQPNTKGISDLTLFTVASLLPTLFAGYMSHQDMVVENGYGVGDALEAVVELVDNFSDLREDLPPVTLIDIYKKLRG